MSLEDVEFAINMAAAAVAELVNEGRLKGDVTLPDATPAVWRLLDQLLFEQAARDDFRFCDHARAARLDGDLVVWTPAAPTLACRSCHRTALASLTGHPLCSMCFQPCTKAAIFAAGPVLGAAWLCDGCRQDADLPGKRALVRTVVSNMLARAATS